MKSLSKMVALGITLAVGLCAGVLISPSISEAVNALTSTDPGICVPSGCPTIECNGTTGICIYHAPDPTATPEPDLTAEPTADPSVPPTLEPTPDTSIEPCPVP